MDEERPMVQPGPGDEVTGDRESAPANDDAGQARANGLEPPADMQAGEPDGTRPTTGEEPSAQAGPAPLEIGWRGVGSTIGRSLDTYGSAVFLFLALGLP